MDKAGELILALLHSGTNAHIHHWTTTSFSQHDALGTYYEEIPGLVDALVESLIGKTGQVPVFPADYMKPAETGLQELEEISEYFQSSRHSALPDDSEIQNLADEIQDLLNTTIFKLRRLK